MPFCTQCGADNPDSSRFCDQCGAVLIPVSSGAQGSVAPAVAPVAIAPVAVAASPATPTAGPSVCPQCGASVIPGEAFCDTCGAPLIATTPASSGGAASALTMVAPQAYPLPQQVGTSTTPPAAPPISQPVPPAARPVPVAPTRATLAPGQLVIESTGVGLALPTLAQAFIGRADSASHFYPEIDLSANGALENGVGRRHLRLFVQDGSIFAEDLDSTNGSFINGQKLAPRQPQQLAAGDELRLGKLALRLQF